MNASLLYDSKCFLGESPMWHPERKSCFWVDIENHMLYEYNWIDQSTNNWKFERKVTLVVRSSGDALVLAFQGGIGRFDLTTGALTWLVDIDREKADIRCNDGACDNQGRLWIGTLQMKFQTGAGALYLLDKNLSLQKKVDNVTISNGIAWSLDKSKMYFIDSPTQKVQCFEYDPGTGDIRFKNTAIEIPKEIGTPDGMAIDEEGMLWIGHYHGFGVYRWNPETGQMLEKISVPAPNVTSCAFAGEALDHLIITTARENLGEDELNMYPESGSLFCVKMRVKGIPSSTCAL